MIPRVWGQRCWHVCDLLRLLHKYWLVWYKILLWHKLSMMSRRGILMTLVISWILTLWQTVLVCGLVLYFGRYWNTQDEPFWLSGSPDFSSSNARSDFLNAWYFLWPNPCSAPALLFFVSAKMQNLTLLNINTQPCGELVACPGCTPPLAWCRLGLAPAIGFH